MLSPEPTCLSQDQGPPSRWLCMEMSVDIVAKISFFDLEGRADGRSVKNIIKAMQPRRIVIVHGSSSATQTLEKFCMKLEPTPLVRTPQVNERVDLTSDLNMYKVKLDNSLVSQVQWAKCGAYEVGYVSGQIAATENSAMDVDDEGITWSLSQMQATAPRPLLHVGQLSLSEFRLKLSSAQVDAQFRGTGKLATGTDGCITVKQVPNQDGKLSISGKLSTDFYEVREQLYKQYTIV